MGIFSCDKKGCERKPYAELFYSVNGKDSRWCYTCFWHYIESRIIRLFRKRDFGWCKVDTDREVLEQLKMELWDIQGDLIQIKQKLGIEQSEEEKEIERNLDVT